MRMSQINKKRLYDPPQECLDIIKLWLSEKGLKSNNTRAVNTAVMALADAIVNKNEAVQRAQETKDKLNKQISKL